MRVYKVTVPCEPMGAPRMTQSDKWKKRDCVVRYRAFKDEIRLAVKSQMPEINASDVQSLSWTAYFSPPQSWSKKRRAAAMGMLHRSKPDRDNVDKGVLDAMFAEDSGIASGYLAKRWGEPARLEITVEVVK